MSEVQSTPSESPPATTPHNRLVQFVLVKIPFAICGVIVLAAVAINIANVVGRYVFNAPVSCSCCNSSRV